MNGSTGIKKPAGRPELPVGEKRDERIELRVTMAEKQQLERLCEQGNVTMTTLLLDSALNGINNLPQFQQVPPSVIQQLSNLQQVAGRLFTYAHRLDEDERTQQQVRNVVYVLGQLSQDLRQQIEQTALPQQFICQLKKLRDALNGQCTPTCPSAGDSRQVVNLINDVLDAYEKTDDVA